LLVGAAGISILAACTGGQSAIEPPSTGADVQNTSSLQFRVGTANYQGTTYLNTVVTFRQPNGLSATLFNTPTITGPPGFVVAGCPAASNGAVPPVTTACSDNGTNHISGTPPTQPGTAAVITTFNQSGGAFAYGFAPANATTGGGANYAKVSTSSSQIPGVSVTNAYTQPIYLATAAKLPFILGPPAVPDFHPNTNPTFPASFAGYDSGFVMFGVTPVAGTYAFNLTVPSANIGANSAVFNQTATLTSLVPLGALTAPVQGGGAGTAVTITVPAAPAGVTSRVIYAAVRPGPSTTTGVLFFAWNVGPAASTVSIAASNMTAGDRVYSWQVGADFDIVGGAPPTNLSPTPALPAQVDVTVSPPQLTATTF
jgi:hypothetical protein